MKTKLKTHCLFYLTKAKVSQEHILIYHNDPPGQTPHDARANCAPDVIQPGFEPGTVVIHLARRYSALHRCASRELIYRTLLYTEQT
jgi:hypothetical protein